MVSPVLDGVPPFLSSVVSLLGVPRRRTLLHPVSVSLTPRRGVWAGGLVWVLRGRSGHPPQLGRDVCPFGSDPLDSERVLSSEATTSVLRFGLQGEGGQGFVYFRSDSNPCRNGPPLFFLVSMSL